MRLYKPQAAMVTNVQRSAGDLAARTGATAANVAKAAKVAVAVKVAKVRFAKSYYDVYSATLHVRRLYRSVYVTTHLQLSKMKMSLLLRL